MQLGRNSFHRLSLLVKWGFILSSLPLLDRCFDITTMLNEKNLQSSENDRFALSDWIHGCFPSIIATRLHHGIFLKWSIHGRQKKELPVRDLSTCSCHSMKRSLNSFLLVFISTLLISQTKVLFLVVRWLTTKKCLCRERERDTEWIDLFDKRTIIDECPSRMSFFVSIAQSNVQFFEQENLLYRIFAVSW